MIEIPLPDTVKGLNPLENQSPKKRRTLKIRGDALLPIKTLAGPFLIGYLFL
jgi:hypothetical protein